MNRMVEFVTRHKKPVVIIFVFTAVICAFLSTGVLINQSMVDYLPKDAESTVALGIMEKEFKGAVPNANVMIQDVTLPEALAYKDELKQIEGVKEILWLDDTTDIHIPIEMMNQEMVETYYKDEAALFSVTVEGGCETEVITDIRKLIGEKGAVSGEAADIAASNELGNVDGTMAMMVLIPVIILILLLTTKSWIEPLLYLTTIGVAVLINLGLNVFLGEVSFVTQTVTPILQFAVSLDYAIFLMHSFEKHKETETDRTIAMCKAVKTSFPAIAASAATTLFGFLALVFMKFRIGIDMGLNLAKAIIISYISVMIFLPALTLSCYKLLEKTKHKRILPELQGIGKVLLKIRIPALLIVAILVVPCFLAQGKTNFFYGMGSADKGTRSGKDIAKIEEVFGIFNPIVVLVPKGDVTKEAALCKELKEMKQVTGVISYTEQAGQEIPSDILPKEIVSNFYSENYARIILNTNVKIEGKEAFPLVKEVREKTKKYYDTSYSCGQNVNMYDVKDVVQKDNTIVNKIALIAIALVLLITFKSLLLPILLVAVIESAIWINLSVPYFQGTTLSYIGFLVINTIQLGATIDYAILMTENYMRKRKDMEKRKAIETAIGDNFISIFTSAVILSTAGLGLYFTASNQIVVNLGLLLARGTVLSFLMVICVLPVLLLIFDKAVGVLSLGSDFFRNSKQGKEKKEGNKMKKAKKTTLISILLLVLMVEILPIQPVAAAENQNKQEKEEVIYASLDSAGNVKQVYAVNILEIDSKEKVEDFGNYEAVQSLSETGSANHQNGVVSIQSERGRFYYQGTMKEKELPWNIELTYSLNGKQMKGSKLGGADGELELMMQTKANPNVDPSFYENYMLQISITLDSRTCKNIVAPGATVANAGSDKLITFTVMPGKEGMIKLTSSVKEFEMKGISIGAVPFAMSVDLGDTSKMTEGVTTLSEAVGLVKDGISELNQGVLELKAGTKELKDGSGKYQEGLQQIAGNSNGLAQGSEKIQAGLNQLDTALASSQNGNELEALQKLPEALKQFSTGLEGMTVGLGQLQDGYSQGLHALDGAIAGIPLEEIPQQDLMMLLAKDPENPTLQSLVENYKAARMVKGVYEQVKGGLAEVLSSLESLKNSTGTMKSGIDTMTLQLAQSLQSSETASSLMQLTQGIHELKVNYDNFHNGLVAYTGGVQTLAEHYQALDSGIKELNSGVSELSTGTQKLKEGSEELYDGTKDLSNQLTQTIEEMKSEYDKSDFIPKSFVSTKNEGVKSVQFVINGEEIKKPVQEEAPQEEIKQESFFTRLLNLFRVKKK
ncbi:MAG: MMPL family transporter [Lachnospiraceae bacterium]